MFIRSRAALCQLSAVYPASQFRKPPRVSLACSPKETPVSFEGASQISGLTRH